MIFPHIISYPLEDDLVLLNQETDCLLVLNHVARLVWEWTIQELTVQQISEKLAAKFDIAVETASQDIQMLYATWQQQGIIRLSDNTDNIKTYTLGNLTFGICYEKVAFTDHLQKLLAPLEVSEQNPPTCCFTLCQREEEYELWLENQLLLRDTLPEPVEGQLLYEIIQRGYPQAKWLAILHAAAISNGEQAMVMPAFSGHGKSTLTAMLLSTGLHYLSDDFVPVQRFTHHVVPVPTCLGIKEGSWSILSSVYPQLDTLPTYPHSRGRQIRYLNPRQCGIKISSVVPTKGFLFPRYLADGKTQFAKLSATESLLRLIEAGIWLGHPINPENVTELLTWLTEIPCFALEYNRFEEALPCVQQLLAL